MSLQTGLKFAFCPFFGYRYIGNDGTDRSKMLHDGTCVPYVSSPLLGEVPPGVKMVERAVANQLTKYLSANNLQPCF